MKEPLTCLERVRAVTKEVAVIETEALQLQGLEYEALLQFHAGSSLRTDFGNWYVPTIEALHNLCRAAGFSRVRTVNGPTEPQPEPLPPARSAWDAGSLALRRLCPLHRAGTTAGRPRLRLSLSLTDHVPTDHASDPQPFDGRQK